MLCNVLQIYYNIVAPISSFLYRYRPIYYGPKMSERHMGTLTARSLKLEESYGVHYIMVSGPFYMFERCVRFCPWGYSRNDHIVPCSTVAQKEDSIILEQTDYSFIRSWVGCPDTRCIVLADHVVLSLRMLGFAIRSPSPFVNKTSKSTSARCTKLILPCSLLAPVHAGFRGIIGA